MAGTREGGLKASRTNRQRYGDEFHKTIGRMGGAVSRGGGFTDRELASWAGRKGGQTSKRH